MNKPERIYVKVDSTFDSTGYMQPTSITWADGRTFPIEKVRDFRPAGTADNGLKEIHMIKETTPTKITQAIIDFCISISSDSSPEYIDVRPEPWTIPNECFNNVRQMVKQYGGSMCLGWAIWQRGNMLLDAEAHAVWKTPDGILFDITPHSYNEKRILFLFDSSLCYQGITIPSHRQALTNSPLVAELIQLCKERDHAMQTSTLENAYTLSADWYNQVRALESIFAQKAGRNDPCPCGSGLKYKKCCGQYQ